MKILYAALQKLLPLVCLAAFSLQEAAGQVTENKYSKVDVTYETLTGLSVGQSSSMGTNPGNALDGNGNTYAQYNGNKNGTGSLVIDCGADEAARKPVPLIEVLSGNNNNQRPVSVKIYLTNTNNTSPSGNPVFQQDLNDSWSNNTASLEVNITDTSNRYIVLSFQARSNGNNYQFRIYELTFKYEVVKDLPTIKHKPAKWFYFRGNVSEAAKGMDTFSDGEEKFTVNGHEVQAAHTYVDTIYMHKGKTVNLTLPDRSENASSVKSYQRWYNCRTDGLFETNHEDGSAYDLLTPNTDGTYYRLANGYVGNPLSNSFFYAINFYYPTDDEFTNWGLQNDGQSDNDLYVVACDVSAYNDYTDAFSAASKNSKFGDNYYEPTLTHRVVFYVVGVDDRTNDMSPVWTEGHGRLTSMEYQGGQATGKYLEEKTIHFPFRRVSNNTKDLVALSKDAFAYAIPDVGQDVDKLDVKLDNNTAGITLVSETVSKDKRIIHFNYPQTDNYSLGYVNTPNDGSDPEATILVTKTVENKTYNIARYRLVFKKASMLLTESIIKQLDDDAFGQSTPWAEYKFRTGKYLTENFTLLTKLDFDYDPSVANVYGNTSYYPFPLGWKNSSYGFYDGPEQGDWSNAYYYPEWGYYAITNTFPYESPDTPSGHQLSGSRYHMYIDASDRPGMLAELPFRTRLCQGAQLFVTAWVKSSNKNTYSDAAMLFTVCGVTNNGTNVPLYRHATGQIHRSDGLNKNIPGSNDNEWFQTYFSFIDNTGIDYDSYVLQVENNCASTAGGDMYLDNIRVYMSEPSAKVEQLQASCSDNPTLMKVFLDWGQVSSRIDMEGDGFIDFCFIDTLNFTQAKADGKDIQEALKASVVKIYKDGTEAGESSGGSEVLRLNFNKTYESNEKYNENTPGQNIPTDGNFFRSPDNAIVKQLLADLNIDLKASRPYWILMKMNQAGGSDVTLDDFATHFDDMCTVIRHFFLVESDMTLKMNGHIVDPKADFCSGSLFNFDMDLMVEIGDRKVNISPYVWSDWFIGKTADPGKEFAETEYGEGDDAFTIKEALEKFHKAYPDAGKQADVDWNTISENAEAGLTSAMIEKLKELATAHVSEANEDFRLYIAKQKVDLFLPENSLYLLVQPIQTVLTDEQKEELGIENVGDIEVCWGYRQILLNTTGRAPSVLPGFDGLQYPSEQGGKLYVPKLRIGLDQINSGKTIRVDLRGATFSGDLGEDWNKYVLGLRQPEGEEDFKKLYLVGSDDPGMTVTEGEAPKVIGTLSDFHAEYYAAGSDFNNYMEIAFNKGFTPKEGCSYTFEVFYEEHLVSGGDKVETINTCRGQLAIEMKVVPKYLVWEGTEDAEGKSGNWNNDANWHRATREELQKPDNDAYVDYNQDKGFVPMRFSKVILPANSSVELYAAGFMGESGQWNELNRPTYIGQPTANIQYDLMVADKEGSSSELGTERYRVSLLDKIHFRPGAQMLHPEYLLYNKAWIDYSLAPSNWHLLASPLQGVVAGDFYTDSQTATEGQELFTSITYSTTDNNRFRPSVYQRGWKPSGADLHIILNDNSNATKETAIAAQWSSLYNKVEEAYAPGSGFSLKVQDLPANATDGQTAVFRLPKADVSYSYYSKDGTGTAGSEQTQIDRGEHAGLLITDDLFVRDPDLESAHEGQPFTVELPDEAHGGYYLVGNPFVAHLDVKEFFADEVNREVLQPKYWTVDDGNQMVQVGSPSGNWVSADDNGVKNIPPLRAFFVQKKEETADGGAVGNTIRFTAEMQTLSATATGGTDDTPDTPDVLRISATTADGRTSHAAVAYDPAGQNGFDASEDAELFLDSNMGGLPMVYTVAGTMAASVNRTADLWDIPVGVYDATGGHAVVKLTFTGLAGFPGAVLYDAEKRMEIPLREGSALMVPGGTAGRYFLRSGLPTANEGVTPAGGSVRIYAVGRGRVEVASTDDLLRVAVYDLAGRPVRLADSLSGTRHTLTLPAGLYVVEAISRGGQAVEKISVRN